MHSIRSTLAFVSILAAATLAACSADAPAREGGGEHAAARGEHDRDGPGHGAEHGGEHGRGGEGEESGTEIGLGERYDSVRGRELGPTVPTDLAPGEKKPVKLTAVTQDFERWSAHPEVGSGEHGGDGGR